VTRRERRHGPAPARTGPVRTCIGCRAARPQADLVRLARAEGGGVEPDPTRRAGGRGAYLCRRAECLEGALRRQAVGHAFRGRARMTPEAVSRLRALLAGPAGAGRADAISSVEGGR
jgi:predicted RNA-binding protein YlxR (DUF448 family)